MARKLLIVIGVAVLVGTVVGLVWGPGAGASVGALVGVLGAMTVVLRRNQRDLHDLEQGRVPAEVDRALGEDHRS